MQAWYEVGIALPAGATGEVRVTCPKCVLARRTRDKSLAVNATRGIWYCFYCRWRGSLRSPQRCDPAPTRVPPLLPADNRKQEAFRRIWHTSQRLTTRDPVSLYLRRRGLTLSLDQLPPVLRYHPHLCYRHDDGCRTYHPALVALVQALDGTMVNVHRTYLTYDGHKANVPTVKKLMPSAVPGATKGGAIRLSPPGETLAIAEGCETALAVRQATGLSVWAAMAASNMALLAVPAVVQLVVICADHDQAGLDAAKALARRLLADGRRVKILTPATPGTDWLDMLEECHA
jgi:putative DNA primase/helicase